MYIKVQHIYSDYTVCIYLASIKQLSCANWVPLSVSKSFTEIYNRCKKHELQHQMPHLGVSLMGAECSHHCAIPTPFLKY